MTAHTPADDQAIEILRELVATPSVSTQEAAAARCAARLMAALGYTATVDAAGNAVGERASALANDGGAPIDIMLLGHIDTVPGHIPVRIEAGVLHGRGAVDAKGPLAAMMLAGAGATLPSGVRLIVVGAVEEECATSRGARFIAQRYRPAACVIGEPSGFDGVTLGYKGRLLVEAHVSQDSSHTAGPSASAPERLVEQWQKLRDLAATRSAGRPRVFDQVQASLRSFQTTSDGLQDSAAMVVGFRLPPGVDPWTFERECKAHAALDTARFYGHEAAHLTSRDAPIVVHFTSAIRAAGAQPRPRVKTGTSDMNVVAPVWNCPIVAYGPGDSSLDHSPHERIVLSEYLRSIRILRDAVERLARDLVAQRDQSREMTSGPLPAAFS